MAIDDPFAALKQQFQMEDLSTSPVSGMLLQVASVLPLPPPFDKIVQGLKQHLAADSLDRIRLMLETCVSETIKNTKAISELQQASMSEDDSEKRVEVIRSLLLDAARKAENTRAKERVKRIGLILANGLEPHQIDADEIEEMMRVAMELSEGDVGYLRELVKLEASVLKSVDYVPRYQAYTTWEHGPWGHRIDPEIDSAFSKLESYGLVSRIPPPNNLNIMADFQNRYVLLKKGVRFVTLIRENTASRET
jgi:hypothetical protein